MGTLGGQELVFIFILALLLFGPKKLPELGRTVGKAITEFRRAQSELKATFDREMKNLERETEFTKEITATNYTADSYNYDYSSYDSNYYNEPTDSTATTSSTTGASAIEGTGTSAPLQIEAAAGTIAAGHLASSHSETVPGGDAGNFADEFPPSAEPSYSGGLHHAPEPAEKTVNS